VGYGLKCILRRILTVECFCEYGTEPTDSVRGGKYAANSNSSLRMPLLHGIFLLQVKTEAVTVVTMRI
jgi:hypothetical protein